VTLTPAAALRNVQLEVWRGQGNVQFHRATWEDLPTQYTIVNAFQRLEIKETAARQWSKASAPQTSVRSASCVNCSPHGQSARPPSNGCDQGSGACGLVVMCLGAEGASPTLSIPRQADAAQSMAHAAITFGGRAPSL
jgi:hypothetical protein